MYEKLSERSEGLAAQDRSSDIILTLHLVLDDRIDEFAEIIREHYGITDLGDPSAATEVCRPLAFRTHTIDTTIFYPLGSRNSRRPHMC